jgi:DNA ligase-1
MTDFQFELVGDGNPSIYETPTLYKLDSTGRLRTWKMQLNDLGHYRTLSGLADGKQAESGWTTPTPASKPTVKEQGEFEVRSQVKHQLDREYHISADTVSQPKMIEPMLAKTYDKWPGPGYAQPKLDGIRCIMTATGMFSRQGQPIIAVPHLHAAAAPLFAEYPDLILDGELYNHDLREDFGAISSIVRKKNPTKEQLELAERVMQYHVYDTVDDNSKFSERNNFLAEAINNLNNGWFQFVPTVICETKQHSDELYGLFIEKGYEGGIYRLDKPYEIGRRSKSLLKRKEFMTEEFPVEQVLEGKGNWAGAAKTIVLRNNPEYAEVDNGYGKGRFGAGIRGSYDTLKKMLADYGGNVPATATATVRFFQRSPDGVPRFPVVIDFQPDGRKD